MQEKKQKQEQEQEQEQDRRQKQKPEEKTARSGEKEKMQTGNGERSSEKNRERHIESNKMGVMPVNRLLLSMSIPMMISMLVQALYNVVDSVFVSKISETEDAFTALSLVFPVQNLMIAVGVGVGVGMNALISKSLGQKDEKRADNLAMQGLLLNFISYLVFLAAGLALPTVFMRSQADNAAIYAYGVDYFRICLTMSFGLFFELIFEKMLQATGRTVLSMIVQGTGAVLNIVLDPILIFGLFGAPRLEVAGAAYATVIGQIAAGILGFVLNVKYNKELRLKLSNLKPDLLEIKEILFIGVPSIVMASIGSVMTLAMNNILRKFSITAVAVFGAYFKLQSFVFMPVFGLNNGMIPIVAYNYGARNKKRMTDTIKYASIYAVAIMFVGIAVCQLIPGRLLEIFNASENMLSIGTTALRIISISFVFAGFCIVASSVFQALGRSVYSMLLSFGRQLVVLVPVAYLLSLTNRLELVWLAYPIAEVASVTLAALFLRRIMKKLSWD